MLFSCVCAFAQRTKITKLNRFFNMIDFLEQLNDFSGAISALACIVSILAFFIALASWSQKHRAKVSGQLAWTHSSQSEMPYVKSLVLHNLKDKELAIHNIYIRYGTNIYLNLLGKDEFDLNYVHVLPAFGTVTFNLGPAYAYVECSERVNLSQLFGRVNWQIILSTNEGKVVVEHKDSYWSPLSDAKGNHYDRLIDVWRADVNDLSNSDENNDRNIKYESYGDRMKYLVVLSVDKKEVDCPIFDERVSQQGYLSGLNYTKDDLRDEKSLKKILNKKRADGEITGLPGLSAHEIKKTKR